MNLRQKLVAASLVLAALVSVAWWKHAATLPIETTSANLLPPLTFSVPAGRQSVYSFHWVGSSMVRWREPAPSPEIEAKLPPQIARGEVDASGQLVVRSFGTQAGAQRFTLRVTSVSAFDLSVLGQPMFRDVQEANAMLGGVETVFDVDPQGHMLQVHVPIEVPQQAAHTLRRMVRWFEISLPSTQGEHWTATEIGPSGKARVGYRRTAPMTLERQRASYESFDFVPPNLAHGPPRLVHHGQVLWSEEGWFAVVDDESLELPSMTGEAAASQNTHVSLERTEVRSFDPSQTPAIDTATHDSRRIDDLTPRADLRKRMLEARVEGFDLSTLRQGLGGVAQSTQATLAFLPKASAWLELHPEDCPTLIAGFGQLDGGGQLLLFDALIGASHPAAQTAMRDALTSAKTLPGDVETALLQRFGQISSPTYETLSFLLDRLRKVSKPIPQREAVVLALGSATRKAGMTGMDVSTEITALRDALRGDGSVTARVQGLRALGNAGRSELVADAAAAARDGDPAIRAAAADALRRTTTEEAQKTLWTLSRDADGDVQAAAFRALREQPISTRAWQELDASVRVGDVSPAAGGALVSLLRDHRASSESVPLLLMHISSDERFDASVRGIAYDLVAASKSK